MKIRFWLRVVCTGLAGLALLPVNAQAVQVGSKRFTESYVLGEIVRQSFEQAGVKAEQ